MSTSIGAGFAEPADREALLALPKTGPALRAFEALLSAADDKWPLDHAMRGYGHTDSVDSILIELDLYPDPESEPYARVRVTETDPDTGETYDDEDATVQAYQRAVAESIVALKSAFREDTETDGGSLEITPRYRWLESRSDEVSGLYYDVSGLYQLSPAGRAFKDRLGVERRFFVTAV